MGTLFLSDKGAILAAIERLFDEKPPVLVEVRFAGMGTSPDWFLCEDAAVLKAILDRLSSGAEIYLSSVWDLKHPASAVAFQINKPGSSRLKKPSYRRPTSSRRAGFDLEDHGQN